MYDAVVIGGGFFGCSIATYLATRRGFAHVLLIEREDALMRRASLRNQARIHCGHHYPRSFPTAYRSRMNLQRFLDSRPSTVSSGYTSVYAIARRNSKVSARQFARFCARIGAPIGRAPDNLRALFAPRLVEDVFVAEEFLFDAAKLATRVGAELAAAKVEIALATRVVAIDGDSRCLRVAARSAHGGAHEFESHYVFNCTYSGINQLRGDFPGTRTELKHELTELALVDLPPAFAGIGITIMDGPFFSVLPRPGFATHSLSHVRYTPHFHWSDRRDRDPYEELAGAAPASRADRMIRDASRYVPELADARHVDSIFEVKTVLARNECDDGRPMLLERHADMPNCISVLGGKIDNVFDVIERLEAEELHAG